MDNYFETIQTFLLTREEYMSKSTHPCPECETRTDKCKIECEKYREWIKEKEKQYKTKE